MILTQERLQELMHYDPDTGDFKWKVQKARCIKIGEVIHRIDYKGYVVVKIDGKTYKLHRLVFLYMEGYLPENQVDHINRIRNDNRWCNLREVSKQCNLRNSKQRIDNTSGVKGVCWFKRDNKWQVNIRILDKKHYLGLFNDFAEAVAHRLAAEQCLDWDGCDLYSPAFLYMKKILKIEK